MGNQPLDVFQCAIDTWGKKHHPNSIGDQNPRPVKKRLLLGAEGGCELLLQRVAHKVGEGLTRSSRAPLALLAFGAFLAFGRESLQWTNKTKSRSHRSETLVSDWIPLKGVPICFGIFPCFGNCS